MVSLFTPPDIYSLCSHLYFNGFSIMLLSLHILCCIITYSLMCLFLKEIIVQGRSEDLVLHMLVSYMPSTEPHSSEI